MHYGATQLEFLKRLGMSPDGQQLIGLIQAEIAECNQTLRKSTGESLLREQGKAIFLDEFLRKMTQTQSVQLVPRRPTLIDTSA
jgi:hypothetical protein